MVMKVMMMAMMIAMMIAMSIVMMIVMMTSTPQKCVRSCQVNGFFLTTLVHTTFGPAGLYNLAGSNVLC